MKNLLLSICLVLLVAGASGATVLFTATTPTVNADGTPCTDLAGLAIFTRKMPALYTTVTATITGSVTGVDLSYLLPTVTSGVYCGQWIAYDTSGNISAPSGEICKPVDLTPPAAPTNRPALIVLGPTNFGNYAAGTSHYKSVTVANKGTAPISIASVSMLGPDNADFRLANSTLPRTVAPGMSTTLRIYFEPQTAGTKYTIVQVTTDAGEQFVPISGNGV